MRVGLCIPILSHVDKFDLLFPIITRRQIVTLVLLLSCLDSFSTDLILDTEFASLKILSLFILSVCYTVGELMRDVS